MARTVTSKRKRKRGDDDKPPFVVNKPEPIVKKDSRKPLWIDESGNICYKFPVKEEGATSEVASSSSNVAPL